MTTRRDFLRQTALLGAGLTISPFFIKAGSAGVGANIIRKTKCFDFWERNVLFPKTKRSFFRTPTLPFSA